MKKIRKTIIPLLIAAAIFFGSATVSAASISSGSTFASTDGTSGRLVINSVNSSISGSTWNISVNCTINMVNSWLYTGGADYDRYFVGTINGVNGYQMQIKSRTESWNSGTSHSFTYNMALPVNPDNNVVSASFRVTDGNGALNDVATFDTGSGYTVSLQAVQKATGLTLNATNKTLYTSDTFTIPANVSPSNTYNKGVTYASSNAAVASVSSGGVITAKQAGTAVITATTIDGSNISQNISVTVLQYVTSISTNVSAPVLYAGETFQLSAQIMPDDASNKTLTYQLADTSIATINNSGLITALKVGNTTITVTAADGSGVSKELPLIVRQKAESIEISNPVSEIYIGTTHQLSVDVLPADTTDKSVSFTSSDLSIAQVSESGIITPLKKGTVTVSAVTRDSSNLSASMTLTVKKYVESITLSESDLTLYTGENKTVTTTVLPQDADNKNCIFVSSDPSIATVSDIGKITALKAGSADITVKASDGSGVSATLHLTVKQKAQSIKISNPIAELYNGTTYQLNVEILPQDTTDKSVGFSSSDESVATVSETGLITSLKKGTVTITAFTKDTSVLSTKITMQIKQHVESLNINPNLTLYTGESEIIIPKILPEDADNKECKFMSSNETVADVSENGKVTALKAGTAIVTVEALDNSNIKAECLVTVRQYAEGIDIGQDQIELPADTSYQILSKVLPNDTSDPSSTFESSNENIAVVDETGLVTAKNPGTVQITVTASDRGTVKAVLTVKVIRLISSIDVPSNNLEIYTEQSAKLDFSVSPADATNKDVTFISDAPDIVSVSADGTITAKCSGTANITIRANDESGVSKTVAVTVWQSVTSITIDNDKITLNPQDTYELSPKIIPDDAYNKNLSFTSSDPSVASVDDQGKITANQTGKAVITIAAMDGSGKSVKMKITVLQPAEPSKDNNSPESGDTPKDEVIDDNHDIATDDNNDIQDEQEKTISQVETTEKEDHAVETNPSSDKYMWYDYLFIVLGLISLIASMLYLIFILIIRRKKDKEKEDQEEDHDHKE